MPEFKTAAVIGTGMMGPGIAVTLALGGVKTTILSRTPDGADQGLEKARTQIRLLEQHGLADREQTRWSAENLSATSDLEAAVADVDLVVESAPENMEFKQDLFARLDALTRPDAVLGTNTSSLSITAVSSKCRYPERALTMHYWNPPHLMPLVEIVKGERTSDETAQAVRRLLIRCGKVPVIVKKDRPGQLGNRLQHAVIREAMYIVQEGIADAEDVDLAAKAGFGLRLPVYGILEHQDAVGLDMVLSIQDYVARDLYNRTEAPANLRQLVSEGKLGAKTGEGFYDWSKKSIDDVKALRDEFVLEFMKSRFRLRMKEEASDASTTLPSKAPYG